MADRYFIERLQDVDSTNRYIRDEASRLWSASPLSEMLVVTCERQTAGRGQRGNVWHSGDGVNLLFSIMVRPAFLAASQQFLLSEAVALALHRISRNLSASRDERLDGLKIPPIGEHSHISDAVLGKRAKILFYGVYIKIAPQIRACVGRPIVTA